MGDSIAGARLLVHTQLASPSEFSSPLFVLHYQYLPVLRLKQVIDFLPIWYEKRGGKIMLPDNMDRSFKWKFLGHFFAYSVRLERQAAMSPLATLGRVATNEAVLL